MRVSKIALTLAAAAALSFTAACERKDAKPAADAAPMAVEDAAPAPADAAPAAEPAAAEKAKK